MALPFIKASEQDIVRALTGHWREEHLFVLGQALGMYDDIARHLRECDTKLQTLLAERSAACVEVGKTPREQAHHPTVERADSPRRKETPPHREHDPRRHRDHECESAHRHRTDEHRQQAVGAGRRKPPELPQTGIGKQQRRTGRRQTDEVQRTRQREASARDVGGRSLHAVERQHADRRTAARLVFGRADRHVADRLRVSRHGLDALLVVADHDVRADRSGVELEMVEEQFERRPPLGLAFITVIGASAPPTVCQLRTRPV